MNETKIVQERALIIAVHLKKNESFDFESSVSELRALCETAGLLVVDTVVQNRDRNDNAFYVGKGKLEEILMLQETEQFEYDVVIANTELTTSQSKHINEMLNVKVIDRTQLILDIFAQRANSREGKLQVELAQLEYLLPRLSGHGVSLSRLGGGIGTRGPGETKLETNRRHIRSRIHDIGLQLETIKAHRKRYRENRKRKQMFQVALVGYTNAGKSTWFNQLSDSETFMEDKLFATLDPKSKVMSVNDGFNILLSDTVGFIQELPTHLIEAFSSTLEEARYADILVHVVDRSHPNYIKHIDTVNQLLKDLDMSHIPLLIVNNKKDRLEPNVEATGKNEILVSARDDNDKQVFKDALIKLIKTTMTHYHIRMLDYDGQTITHLKNMTMVETLNFNEENDEYEMTGFENKENGVIDNLITEKKVEII